MITTAHDNLAKLMSVEDITVIQTTDPTASFDTKDRILRMPNWKDLTDLETQSLIGHEIGHALYTDYDEWMKAIYTRKPPEIFKDYLNVVEDARIERLVKARYPGMKKIFFEGYKRILQRDFMQLDPNEDLPLIDVLNLHFKFFGLVDLKLHTIHKEFIKRIEEIQSFKDVVSVSQDIFDYCYDKGQESRLESNDYQILVSVESNESNDSQSTSNQQNNEIKSKSSDKQNKSNESSEKESESDESDSKSNTSKDTKAESNKELSKKSSGKQGGESGSNAPDTSKTIRNLEKNLKSNIDRNDNVTYCDLPKPDLNKIIIGYKDIIKDIMRSYGNASNLDAINEGYYDEEIFDDKRPINTKIKEFLKVNGSSITLHKQLFEMRKKASEYNKTMIFRSGVLDMNKMYSYKYDDQIFKTYEVKPNGKKHGLVFILDLSGSMSTYLKGVKKKVLELIMFCKQVNIPFVCYGFSDNMYSENRIGKFTSNGKMGKTLSYQDNFKLFEIFNSKMTEPEFKIMFGNFLSIIGYSGKYGLSGTPLNETHLCLDALVSKFRTETKAKIVNVIYFTDGQGQSLSVVGKGVNPNKDPWYNSSYNTISGVVVLHDSKTKKNYSSANYMDENNLYHGFTYPDTQQKMLLDIMRDRMKNVKIINFYITDNPYEISWTNEEIQKIFGEDTVYNSIGRKFVNEVCVYNRSNYAGFDEIFLMASNLLKLKRNSIADVKGINKEGNKISTKSLSTTFKKVNKTKSKTNIIISKFIDLIV